eukprot:TRINITY_DN1452_c0_g1_i9.p1 TRINITY_DN1452_c0_g1~~TRINITY_DN1452_c0_g1_i9.p1  ORF type:complete len:407 (-),score=51.71 TRINITY_DN1452_c0_g1_i9:77-1297(-)
MLSSLNKNLFSSYQKFPSAYIVAAKRSPIGCFMGKLSGISPIDLEATVIKDTMKQINLDPKLVDEVLLGCVIQAGLGQNPADTVSMTAGLPTTVGCTTINKVCASGMKTVMQAAMSINLGINNCVVTGGFESMSRTPFYLLNHRKAVPYGHQQIVDATMHDGLWDVMSKQLMGNDAEKTAQDFKVTREDQDQFAIASYEKAIAANKKGIFKTEITPITINPKKKEIMTEDEEFKRYNKEKMLTLRTPFKKNGTITAGNASKINDGACSLLVVSEQMVNKLNLKPMARIAGFGDGHRDPIDFCIAPALAVPKALAHAGLKPKDIDYHEINEAFSVTVIANQRLLDIDPSRVNIHGGAVAMGHPVGVSGARVIISLMNVLKQKNAKYGMASICNGGGGASAICLENLQ